MSVDSSEQAQKLQRTFYLALNPPTLLKGYCGWHRRSTRQQQQQQQEPIFSGFEMSQPRQATGARGIDGVNKTQTSLSLIPSLPLTARYYATHKKMQAAAGQQPLGQQLQGEQTHEVDKVPGVCKRYPFSQVIYSNILATNNDSMVDNFGQPVKNQRLKAAQPPLLSYLPKPGGLPVPSSSSARSPSFVHRRRVARERSSVSGPLDRALASDRSSEVVVRRAITQLRDAMQLPQQSRLY